MFAPSEPRPIPMVVSPWWSLVLRGLLAVAFGVIVLAAPKIGVLALLVVFGVYAAIDGIMALTIAVRHARARRRWGLFALEGVVSIAAAVLAFVWPAATLLALVVIVAIRAIAVGIVTLVAATTSPRVEHKWLAGLSGVLSIAFGVLLLLQPLAGIVALAWLVGVYAVIIGVVMIALGLEVHSVEERPAIPQGGIPAT